MKIFSTSFAIFLATLCIGGCSSKDAAAPDCSDPGVITLTNGIAATYINKNVMSRFETQSPLTNLFDMSVGTAAPVLYNESVKARYCTAKLTIIAKQSARDGVIAYVKETMQLAKAGGAGNVPQSKLFLVANIDAGHGNGLLAGNPISWDVTYTVQMQEKSQGDGYTVDLQLPDSNNELSNLMYSFVDIMLLTDKH